MDVDGQVRCLALDTASKLDLLHFLYPIMQQDVAYEEHNGLSSVEHPQMRIWRQVARDVLRLAAQRGTTGDTRPATATSMAQEGESAAEGPNHHRAGTELLNLAEAINFDRAVVTKEIIDAERKGVYIARQKTHPHQAPHRPLLHKLNKRRQ